MTCSSLLPVLFCLVVVSVRFYFVFCLVIVFGRVSIYDMFVFTSYFV
jgi:hypothetical protein